MKLVNCLNNVLFPARNTRGKFETKKTFLCKLLNEKEMIFSYNYMKSLVASGANCVHLRTVPFTNGESAGVAWNFSFYFCRFPLAIKNSATVATLFAELRAIKCWEHFFNRYTRREWGSPRHSFNWRSTRLFVKPPYDLIDDLQIVSVHLSSSLHYHLQFFIFNRKIKNTISHDYFYILIVCNVCCLKYLYKHKCEITWITLIW